MLLILYICFNIMAVFAQNLTQVCSPSTPYSMPPPARPGLLSQILPNAALNNIWSSLSNPNNIISVVNMNPNNPNQPLVTNNQAADNFSATHPVLHVSSFSRPLQAPTATPLRPSPLPTFPNSNIPQPKSSSTNPNFINFMGPNGQQISFSPAPNSPGSSNTNVPTVVFNGQPIPLSPVQVPVPPTSTSNAPTPAPSNPNVFNLVDPNGLPITFTSPAQTFPNGNGPTTALSNPALINLAQPNGLDSNDPTTTVLNVTSALPSLASAVEQILQIPLTLQLTLPAPLPAQPDGAVCRAVPSGSQTPRAVAKRPRSALHELLPLLMLGLAGPEGGGCCPNCCPDCCPDCCPGCGGRGGYCLHDD